MSYERNLREEEIKELQQLLRTAPKHERATIKAAIEELRQKPRHKPDIMRQHDSSYFDQ
jgi:hypothetical protein